MLSHRLSVAFLRKTVMGLLCVAILTHLALFIYAVQHKKISETKVNHELMIASLLDFIGHVRNDPDFSVQQQIVTSLDSPNIIATIDPNPHYVLQLPISMALWQIGQHFNRAADIVNVSLYLSPTHWLNISSRVVEPTWTWQLYLLISEIIIIIVVLFSLWTINQFSEPLVRFRQKADRLGIELDSPPLPVTGPELVRQTALAMNKMQQRIDELIKERTQMLAALSHDLRTPITRMKLRAHLFNDPEHFQKTMNDLDEMEQMVNDSLAFAKTQTQTEKRVKCDLNAMLATIEDNYNDLHKQVKFIQPKEKYFVLVDPVALKRVFSNLIDNAVKYGHTAQISVQAFKHEINIHIDDEGPGIPVALHEKVFEPYFRAENSRSRETGGVGLGLAVCREIIRAHGGKIKLANLTPKGLRITVSLVR